MDLNVILGRVSPRGGEVMITIVNCKSRITPGRGCARAARPKGQTAFPWGFPLAQAGFEEWRPAEKGRQSPWGGRQRTAGRLGDSPHPDSTDFAKQMHFGEKIRSFKSNRQKRRVGTGRRAANGD